MSRLHRRAFVGLLFLIVGMGTALFISAGTMRYWQAWVFLGLYFVCSLAVTLYLAKHDPALLARRMRGGPFAEKQPARKIIMSFASLGFIGLLVVSGFVPLSLGSWWGVLAMAVIVPAVILRLLDEEKFLAKHLDGYVDYQNRVRYRLLPPIW